MIIEHSDNGHDQVDHDRQNHPDHRDDHQEQGDHQQVTRSTPSKDLKETTRRPNETTRRPREDHQGTQPNCFPQVLARFRSTARMPKFWRARPNCFRQVLADSASTLRLSHILVGFRRTANMLSPKPLIQGFRGQKVAHGNLQ